MSSIPAKASSRAPHEKRSSIRPARVRPARGSALLVLGVLGAGLSPRAARAQDAAPSPGREPYAVDTFQPSFAHDRFFTVQDPQTGGDAGVALRVSGDYAREPLVVYQVIGGEETKQARLIENQLTFDLGVSLALANRIALALDLPLVPVNSGDGFAAATAAPAAAPDGGGIGDFRIGARIRLYGEYADPFQIALTGYVHAPTGSEERFLGEGSLRGTPGLALGGRAGSVLWGASGGVTLRPEKTFLNNTMSHQFVWSAGIAGLALEDRLQIGPELYGSSVVAGDDAGRAGTTSIEALLGLKYRVQSVVLGAGAGVGLTRGTGTPIFRGVVSLAFAPTPDTDGDGVPDDQDACRTVPGPESSDPRKNGCPDDDQDDDGVPDGMDACPSEAGPATGDALTTGCPDSDGDGILDRDDACPSQPGVRSELREKNGCPPPGDRDGDGIPDEADKCPDEPGERGDDPDRIGCPARDRDGDGVPDDKDACPDTPGVASPESTKNGCPADTDGDGIPDDKDACPRESGPADPDSTKNGCPTKVRVTDQRIEILQQVQFKTGSDVILPQSDALLTEVANVLKEHPEIKLLAVDGHTDDRGPEAFNQKLSEKRAASVKKWLVTRGGVEATRLESRGFGESQPVADNKTAEGRGQNRRVEFNILRSDKKK